MCARCPYEKDIFISVDRGDAHCSTGEGRATTRKSKDEKNGRGQKKKGRGKKELRARVKGKSASPVRRSHYRLGFDCSGSAGTGATRYTLYSASVRFLEIHSENEGVRHPRPCAHVYTHVHAYTICNSVIHPRVSFSFSLSLSFRTEGKEKEPGKVCRSIFDYVRQRIRDIKDNYGLSTQG